MQTVGFFPAFNTANAETLFTVQVTANGSTMNLLPHAPSFPPFLADITDSEIKGTKVLTFATTSNAGAPTSPSQHTIDGKKFDGEVGAVVGLNKAEEWKIVNQTYAFPGSGTVSHPFHIHINPFQVTEVFDPNATLPNGQPMYITSGTPAAGQCLLDPAVPSTWHPCQPQPKTNLVWWDVFPIPSGLLVPDPTDKTKYIAQIPGYFKMRSRFVDYFGYYVMHCHILAHEDRGMMTVVEVAPLQTPYAHH
jgi:FtsP/CotA-like multicopper oxidase with cupredoxin domain